MRVSSLAAVIAASLLGLGCQSNTTDVITTPLPAPNSLSSISLNAAIHLQWADNAAQGFPDLFGWYQVYSTGYNLSTGFCNERDWAIEGTTASDEFLAALHENGVPLCFAVSAFSDDGVESEWSPLWQDTPRPDARNVLVYAFQTDADSSGFRFWDDVNGDGIGQSGELGLIENGETDVDFVVRRNASDSTLWIVPVFSGTSMQLYSSSPVADLTSIDFAPETGYSHTDSLLARPGFGYVFEIVDGSVLHYGALRATHVGRQYLIFDFSVQTDSGNAELAVPQDRLTAGVTGSQVPGSQ